MRSSLVVAVAIIAPALIAAAGCMSRSPGPSAVPGSQGLSTPASTPGSSDPLETGGPDAPSPAGSPPEYPAAIVDPIVADAAARAGVDLADVTVESYEDVTWPDGSLGCPLPGVQYTQVQVDGYQMIIVVGEDRYDYRGRGPGDFKLCPKFVPQPLPEESVPGIRY